MKVQLLPENAAYADQLVKEMQLRNYSPGTIKTYSNLLSKLAEYFSLFKIFQVDIFCREWEQIRIRRPRREKSCRLFCRLMKWNG